MKRTAFLGIASLLALSVLADPGDLSPADPGNCRPEKKRTLFSDITTRIRLGGQDKPDLSGLLRKEGQILPDTGLKRPDAIVFKGQGFPAFAIDSEGTAEALDILRIDPSGQGKFVDGMSLGFTVNQPFSIKIDFKVAGKTCPAMISGVVKEYNEFMLTKEGKAGSRKRYHLDQVRLDSALEGTCLIGGKELKVTVVDGTSNLKWNDAAKCVNGVAEGDFVVLSLKGGKTLKAWCGQPVCLDGKWYDLVVGDDMKIKAAERTLKSGKVKLSHANGELVVQGESVFTIDGRDGKVALPVGKYALGAYRESELKDGVRGKAGFTSMPADGQDQVFVEVKAGKTTEIQLGSPLKAKLNAVRIGKNGPYGFSIARELVDSKGYAVKELCDAGGKNSYLPNVVVKDRKGKEVYSGKFEFG